MSFLYFRYTYPFRDRLDEVFDRISASGIYIKMLSDYIGVHFEENFETSIVLTIEHILSVFIIFFIGNTFGIVVFLLEILYNNYKNNN